MKWKTPWWTAVVVAIGVSGCASAASLPTTAPTTNEGHTAAGHPADPWEGFNRAIFSFNEGVDRVVVKPLAQGYDAIVPDLVKRGVRNFFGNLGDPWIGFNNLLQGKVGEAFSDWMRFGFNTTFGVFGLFDIASEAGLPKHNEDLGQTLARWGVGDGPYVVLPLLGPRTLRDAIAWPVDRLGDPSTHLADDSARFAVKGVDVVATRATFLPADAQKVGAIDPYAFVRDAYLQRRHYLIYDGNPPIVYERYE
jgi:phospholipid-binding lipoprotein MlaA